MSDFLLTSRMPLTIYLFHREVADPFHLFIT